MYNVNKSHGIMDLGKGLQRIFSILFATGLLVGAAACTTGGGEDSAAKVLRGATLFNGTGGEAVANSVIVVEGDRITCVGAEGECSIPANAEEVDVSGKYITPGLVDAHVHFFQTAFFDSRPDALDLRGSLPYVETMAYQQQHPERYYDAYLCSGITGVYDVGGFPWSVGLQQSAESDPAAPHVAAAGPLITPSTMQLLNTPADKTLVTLDSEETGRKTVQYLAGLGATGVKLWQLRADSEEYMSRVEAVAGEASQHGMQVIAHATSLSQAKAAMRNGTRLLVHSVSNTDVDEEFLELAGEQGTIYTPTLVVSSGYMLAYRAAAGVADFPMKDPMQCVDSRTRAQLTGADRFSDHPQFTEGFVEQLESFDPSEDRLSEQDLANLKAVYDAGIPIAVGTDAGNPGTLHGPSIFDEMEAMQQAGIPAEDLIVMATRNGADAMRRLDDFGTLEEGKLANLVVVNEDPSADIANMRSREQVMIKGNLLSVEEIQEQ